jgi:hypothetical protein
MRNLAAHDHEPPAQPTTLATKSQIPNPTTSDSPVSHRPAQAPATPPARSSENPGILATNRASPRGAEKRNGEQPTASGHSPRGKVAALGSATATAARGTRVTTGHAGTAGHGRSRRSASAALVSHELFTTTWPCRPLLATHVLDSRFCHLS